MGQTYIVGYHGTSESSANLILQQNCFKPSQTTHEWLGKGIYFFEDRNHAIGWANIRSRKGHSETAVVLAADISFKKGELFDLDIPQNVIELEKFCAQTLKSFKTGAPHFKNLQEIRCFWSDYYKETHPNIKVMAYTFESTEQVLAGFPIKQRQLCINDHSVISNIRKVYTAQTSKGGYYRG